MRYSESRRRTGQQDAALYGRRDTANRAYYGQPVTTSDILFGGKVKPTQATLALAEQITVSSKLARK
jgi:hypothetical protein